MKWRKERLVREIEDSEGKITKESTLTFKHGDGDTVVEHGDLCGIQLTITVMCTGLDVEMRDEIVQSIAAAIERCYTRRNPRGLSAEELAMKAKLDHRIESAAYTQRAINGLKYADIVFIGQLVQKTEQELSRIRHLGKKSVREIRELLADEGLSLGMKIPFDWQPPDAS